MIQSYLPLKFLIIYLAIAFSIESKAQTLPHLVKNGAALQLVVNDKPYLVLGGELGNSSASDLTYMAGKWAKLKNLNLNTLIVPVYWELMEPEEGIFDFSLTDSLIAECRKHDLKLILLWFGSWKNSMSCYVPSWIKTNQARFPRAKLKNGVSTEILSPFYEENVLADMKAYRALLKHLSQIDNKENTVIMIQVENEIGMIPDARDYSDHAAEEFKKPVPAKLMNYLMERREKLIPEFYAFWKANGFKTTGNWEEIFGKGIATDEVFMAWQFAAYVEKVAAAGKAEYKIPMYVNAALIRQGYQPGQYPSAGPLPHLLDIWHAGAPLIDIYSPDIYFPDFEEWCRKYHQSGNPLFIPEARHEPEAAMKAFYAIGAHDAIGFSPFAIEQLNEAETDPLTKSYKLLSQLTPLILENQGKQQITGFILDHSRMETQVTLGEFILHIKHIFTLNYSPKAKENEWPMSGGIIICTGPGKYIIGGSGIVVTFEPLLKDGSIAGILSADQGSFENGAWKQGRRMNGDEDHQGRHVRIFEGNFEIQKVELYLYK